MNPVWMTAFMLALPARAENVSSRAVAWAAESPRPAQCGGVVGFWQVARRAFVASACRGLARGYAALASKPAVALQEAARILDSEPEFASARILRGRALFRLGRSAEALNDLSRLLVESAALSAEPAALLDGGRAALVTAELGGALEFYRALGSRAALLPDRPQQAVAYLEIAAAALAGGAGPDEVSGYLGEARRRASATGFAELTTALFALNLAVAGNESALAAELGALVDAAALSRFESEREASSVGAALLGGPAESNTAPAFPRAIYLPDGLLHAVLAVALERSAPTLARAEYAAFFASRLGRSAWAAPLAARQQRLSASPVRQVR